MATSSSETSSTTTSSSSTSSSTRFISAALDLGQKVTSTQDLLLKSFQLEDGDKTKIQSLAKELGLTAEQAKIATPRSLQLIAQQKFQDQNNLVTLMTSILEKIDQVKQRILSNIGR